MIRRIGLVCVFGVLFPLVSLGQVDTTLTPDLRRGIEAFREGHYEKAQRFLERAAREHPQNPEVHYMLARLYFETPLRNVRKAGQAINRALALDPENIRYLVARLQQLRVKSWNFITERLRDVQRQELARKILALDSTNAFAHEELGISFIHDFWRYRNAIMLPHYNRGERSYRKPVDESKLERPSPIEQQPVADNEDAINELTGLPDAADLLPPPVADINTFFSEDAFDLKALESEGVIVQRLSARAERAYRRAIKHLKKALEQDPRRRPVYERLMQVYALKEDYEPALDMLRQMYVFFPEDAYTWLYLGYVQYKTGAPAEAEKSFETALRYMDPEMKAAFQNLEYILPEEEKEAYHKDPVGYAARFWRSKDPRLLTPYNERKLEHFARMVYADLLYGAPDIGLHGWNTERGRLLIRYGIPRRDVVIVPANTARALKPFNDQRVKIEEVRSSYDMLEEANTYNIWDYGDFKIVFEDPFRNGEYRLYSPPADELAGNTNAWLSDYSIKLRETLRRLPERYTYEAPGRQVEIPYLVNVFKGSEGLADIYVHYGIPIQGYQAGQRELPVTIRTGAFLVSKAREILAERRQTIYGLKTERILSFKEANLWTDTQTLKAPAGSHEVSLEFETASGMTVAVQRRTIEVPDFSNQQLAISDLLLAYHIEEAENGKPVAATDIVRGDLSITPAPWSVFSVKQPIYLYFEVYNLSRGKEGQSAYEVEAILKPKDTSTGITRAFRKLFGGKKGVSVRFEGGGMKTEDAQYLILDATGQQPGIYTLILRVTDKQTGRTVEKHRDLFLE